MAIGARKGSGERDYPIHGTHMARLVGITDLGHQAGYEYKGNPIASSWKLELTYELVNSLMKDGRPHWVSEEVKNNNYDKNGKMSNLMARVRAIDPENSSFDAQDLTKLLGRPCMVTVNIDDKGYAKVSGQSAVSGVPFGMDVPEVKNEPFVFTFSNDEVADTPIEPDMEIWERMSDFTKEKIKRALNFAGTGLSKELAIADQY